MSPPLASSAPDLQMDVVVYRGRGVGLHATRQRLPFKRRLSTASSRGDQAWRAGIVERTCLRSVGRTTYNHAQGNWKACVTPWQLGVDIGRCIQYIGSAFPIDLSALNTTKGHTSGEHPTCTQAAQAAIQNPTQHCASSMPEPQCWMNSLSPALSYFFRKEF